MCLRAIERAQITDAHETERGCKVWHGRGGEAFIEGW